MKWKLSTLLLCSAALLGGCAVPTGDFCLIARKMYFRDQAVVTYLSERDPRLLEDIVAHDELLEKCP